MKNYDKTSSIAPMRKRKRPHPAPPPPPPPPFPVPPTGQAYLPQGQILKMPILIMPQVDIAVCGGTWCDIEQTEGAFQFDSTAISGHAQSLKAQLDMVDDANVTRSGLGLHPLAVRMEIGIGDTFVDTPGFDGNKPAWLKTKILATGRNLFEFVDRGLPSVIPAFWDPDLLNGCKLLMQAVQGYLNTRGTNTVFCTQVSFASASSDDWNLGDTSQVSDGVFPGTPTSRWLDCLADSAYPVWEDAVIAAGNQMFSDFHAACPNLLLLCSIGRVPGNNNVLNPGGAGNFGRNIANTVLSTAVAAFPGKIVAAKWNLNGGGAPHAPPPDPSSPWYDLWLLIQAGCLCALQATWHCYQDATCIATMGNYGAERMNAGVGSDCIGSTRAYRQSIATAKTYGALFAEMYEVDLYPPSHLGAGNLDPDPGGPPDVVQYGHDVLYVAP